MKKAFTLLLMVVLLITSFKNDTTTLKKIDKDYVETANLNYRDENEIDMEFLLEDFALHSEINKESEDTRISAKTNLFNDLQHEIKEEEILNYISNVYEEVAILTEEFVFEETESISSYWFWQKPNRNKTGVSFDWRGLRINMGSALITTLYRWKKKIGFFKFIEKCSPILGSTTGNLALTIVLCAVSSFAIGYFLNKAFSIITLNRGAYLGVGWGYGGVKVGLQ